MIYEKKVQKKYPPKPIKNYKKIENKTLIENEDEYKTMQQQASGYSLEQCYKRGFNEFYPFLKNNIKMLCKLS